MKQNNSKSVPSIYVFLLILIATTYSLDGFAQEYEYEIGGALGTSFYMGDANKSNLFQNQHPAIGVLYRYNRNFRWAYKVNLVVGGVSGNTLNSGNVFPKGENSSFKRTFCELGGQVEFNFFHYSDKYSYLGTKRFSPYLFTGLGLTSAFGNKTFVGLNLPLGLGLKYKLKDRLNVGFEFSFRKLFGDSFDSPKNGGLSLDDPYGIKSSSFKNKDWYVLTMLSLTWDFGERKKSCVNSIY